MALALHARRLAVVSALDRGPSLVHPRSQKVAMRGFTYIEDQTLDRNRKMTRATTCR